MVFDIRSILQGKDPDQQLRYYLCIDRDRGYTIQLHDLSFTLMSWDDIANSMTTGADEALE